MKALRRVSSILIGVSILLALDYLSLSINETKGTLQAQDLGAEERDRYNMEGVDKWNRVAALYARERAGAKSGWQRGQEIYYMKCWFCHSEMVTVGDHFPAPSLRNIFDRANEAYIKAMLRSGSAGMPTYTPSNLSDKDIDDLVAYLKQKCGTFDTGSGCFDEHNPPPNPLYKYNE